MFYSLGIKDEQLFLSRYLAGAVLLAVPMLFCYLLLLVANLAVCGFSGELILSSTFIFLSLLSTALSVFSITVCVCICCGHIAEAVAFSAIINTAPVIAVYLIYAMMKKFILGFVANAHYTSYSSGTYELEYLKRGNNIFSSVNALVGYFDYYAAFDGNQHIWRSPNFIPVVFWLAFSALLCFAGMRIARKRRSESCGFFGKSRGVNFTVALTASAFAAFVALSALEPKSQFISFLTALIVLVAVYIALELILTRKLKPFLRELKKLAFVAIAFAAAVTAVHFIGYETYTVYVPASEDIDSVRVSSYSDFNIGSSYDLDAMSYADLCGTIYSGRACPNFHTKGDRELVRQLHEHCIEMSTSSAGENHGEIEFEYTLKNGKTVVRRFYLNFKNEESVNRVIALEESDWYRGALNSTLYVAKPPQTSDGEEPHLSISEMCIVSRNCETSRNVMTDWTNEELFEFTELMKGELIKRSARQKYFSQDGVVCFLKFIPSEKTYNYRPFSDVPEAEKTPTKSNSEWVYNELVYEDAYVLIPVTSDMTETLEYLKKGGWDKYFSDSAGEGIASVRINKAEYSNYGNSKVFITRIYSNLLPEYEELIPNYLSEIGERYGDISDEARINELFESSLSYGFLTDGYILTFEKENGDVFTRWLPAEKAPEYVKTKS